MGQSIIWPLVALALVVLGWKVTAQIGNQRNRMLLRALVVAVALTPVPVVNIGFYPASASVLIVILTALNGRIEMWQLTATVIYIGASWLLIVGITMLWEILYRHFTKTPDGR